MRRRLYLIILSLAIFTTFIIIQFDNYCEKLSKYSLEDIIIEGIAKFENKADFEENGQYKVIQGSEVRKVLAILDRSKMNFVSNSSELDWTYRITFNYSIDNINSASNEIVFMVGEKGIILNNKLYNSNEIYPKGKTVYEAIIDGLNKWYFNDEFGEMYNIKFH